MRWRAAFIAAEALAVAAFWFLLGWREALVALIVAGFITLITAMPDDPPTYYGDKP